jgi:hypothetical protein
MMTSRADAVGACVSGMASPYFPSDHTEPFLELKRLDLGHLMMVSKLEHWHGRSCLQRGCFNILVQHLDSLQRV